MLVTYQTLVYRGLPTSQAWLDSIEFSVVYFNYEVLEDRLNLHGDYKCGRKTFRPIANSQIVSDWNNPRHVKSRFEFARTIVRRERSVASSQYHRKISGNVAFVDGNISHLCKCIEVFFPPRKVVRLRKKIDLKISCKNCLNSNESVSEFHIPS